MPVSNNPWKNAPITLNVRKKTSAIMKIKAGMAVYFPVRILSIFWLRECSLLSLGFTTVCLQTRFIKEKRIFAMAALRSSPLSFSICKTMCSSISISL